MPDSIAFEDAAVRVQLRGLSVHRAATEDEALSLVSKCLLESVCVVDYVAMYLVSARSPAGSSTSSLCSGPCMGQRIDATCHMQSAGSGDSMAQTVVTPNLWFAAAVSGRHQPGYQRDAHEPGVQPLALSLHRHHRGPQGARNVCPSAVYTSAWRTWTAARNMRVYALLRSRVCRMPVCHIKARCRRK